MFLPVNPVGSSIGMWTDDAIHRLDRMPPYLAPLVRGEVEQDVRVRGERVVTYDMLLRPRTGERIEWEPEAERRLDRCRRRCVPWHALS